MPDYLESLDTVIRDVVGPAALATDQAGTFPAANIQALSDAGLLGLLSAQEVGGAGESLRSAASVVERLSTACGSTAMVMMMHYSAVRTVEALGPRDVREAIASGKVMALIHASDAAEDGCRKLDGKFGAAARGANPAPIRIFSADELGLASGKTNVIHAALIQGGAAAKFLASASRAERYRKGAAAFAQPIGSDTDKE